MPIELRAKEIAGATGGIVFRGDPERLVRGVYTDTRTPLPGALFVALKGENFDGHRFVEQAAEQKAAAVLMGSVEVAAYEEKLEKLDLPIVSVTDTLKALGDLAAFWRKQVNPRTVGVTGSVGKTTVKNLIGTLVRQRFRTVCSRGNYNNLIGMPLEALRMDPSTEMLIVECGADRPGEISRLAQIAGPQVGVVTEVAPSHLERFGSLERIAEEKGQLLASLEGPEAIAFVYHQAAELGTLMAQCRCSLERYGVGSDGRLRAENISMDDGGRSSFRLCEKDQSVPVRLQIAGMHQVDNALGAATVARHFGIELEGIAEALGSYSGEWGRMQVVTLEDGAILVEDLYNSNPASMQAALDYLAARRGRKRIAVFGDMWDLGAESEHWHRVVGRQITHDHTEVLVAVGPLSRGFVEGSLESRREPREVEHFPTAQAAIEYLRKQRSSDSLILVKGSRGMKMEEIARELRNG